jgi:DNA-binding response OmpR family regulator
MITLTSGRAIADRTGADQGILGFTTPEVCGFMVMSETQVDHPSRELEKKILLVDDDEVIRGLLKDFLATEGFVVETAQDGEEGVLLYDQFRPDVVVADLVMPGKNGFELIAELRTKDPKVRVIYISGCLNSPLFSEEMRKDLSQHPECQALSKPFDLDMMLQSIERALRW